MELFLAVAGLSGIIIGVLLMSWGIVLIGVLILCSLMIFD